ncbi:MAG TPA: right-handed parallel beta-helix repeat-containing protein [Polyangia bacterium]|nr:right-handed parallel beta-helix repeat-containing protein [Polyangia bacterium]
MKLFQGSKPWVLLATFAGLAAWHGCASSEPGAGSNGGTSGGGGGKTGGGNNNGSNGGFGVAVSPGPSQPFQGVVMPWPIFDGTLPDTPEAVAPAHTWYADPVNGNDANDGSSMTAGAAGVGPKKTLTGALKNAAMKAGDTLLLKGGLYREVPKFDGPHGTATALLTIGSYGRGTGAPVIDGGLTANPWTKYSGEGQTTVWKSSTAGLSKITSSSPVRGIYVNNGTKESALLEVAHGQLAKYSGDPLPSGQTQKDVTDNSNKWFFDAGAGTLYADFGGTLGTADPNKADISILYATHDPLIVLYGEQGYYHFVGLTIRAGAWHGVYSETSGNVFEHCDVKFNGGGGIFFDTAGVDTTVHGNQVKFTRIWMNGLNNWPRFNNQNASGGWPGSLSWYSQSDSLSQGNVIYNNGGEGQIFWGTNANEAKTMPHVSTNNASRNNVIFDNFAVNMYVDNTQGLTLEQNFVFQHPLDLTQTFDKLFDMSEGYRTDWGRRMTPVNVSLADEPGSAYDGHAHLSGIALVNNIFGGGKLGFVDYDDGTTQVVHGLRNCVISNNTWIMSNIALPSAQAYGWRHLNWKEGGATASMNSVFENNIIVTTDAADHAEEIGVDAATSGITNDYNLYAGPGKWHSVDTDQTFDEWKTAHPTWDMHSLSAADAMLTDINEFNQTAAQKAVYDWRKAALATGSPGVGAGMNPMNQIKTDFTGATRPAGASDLGALVH